MQVQSGAEWCIVVQRFTRCEEVHQMCRGHADMGRLRVRGAELMRCRCAEVLRGFVQQRGGAEVQQQRFSRGAGTEVGWCSRVCAEVEVLGGAE
jgi:hypothetical protein